MKTRNPVVLDMLRNPRRNSGKHKQDVPRKQLQQFDAEVWGVINAKSRYPKRMRVVTPADGA